MIVYDDALKSDLHHKKRESIHSPFQSLNNHGNAHA